MFISTHFHLMSVVQNILWNKCLNFLLKRSNTFNATKSVLLYGSSFWASTHSDYNRDENWWGIESIHWANRKREREREKTFHEYCVNKYIKFDFTVHVTPTIKLKIASDLLNFIWNHVISQFVLPFKPHPNLRFIHIWRDISPI